MTAKVKKTLLIRFVISMTLALVFGFAISEFSFQTISSGSDHEPQDYEIVIPDGTSERIGNGLPVPSIPENMVFYEGDKIIVKNEDVTSHQLGPIWVPAGSTGTLTLENPQSYTLSCSFQTSKILGIDVLPRLTNNIRLEGLLAIGLPSGVLLWLFTIVIFPFESKNPEEVIP